MKNPILVAVILQLVVTIIEINGYQFGDIIAFPRGCDNTRSWPVYIHFAIYVGPKSEKDVGQKDNEDIVHHTSIDSRIKCTFGQLSKEITEYQEKKYNFLDGILDYEAGTPDVIHQRITDVMNKCPIYFPSTQNCEHFATTIRYGKTHSLQCGAVWAEKLITFSSDGKKLLESVREKHKEVTCTPRS